MVYRGLNIEGVALGSTSTIASVDYEVTSENAVNGLDFIASNGQIMFLQDQTQATISIQIVNDDLPELEESFLITLKSDVGNVVLTNPTQIRVFINANDKHNGVLSFMSPDTSTPPYVQLNEDSNHIYAIYTVLRTAGTFGNVSVPYQVTRDDTLPTPVQNSVLNTNGVLVFLPGQVQQTINITLVKDSVPEPTERLRVSLLAGGVTGGAEVEGVLHAILVIEDSDEYYGTVQFGTDFDQKIVIVSMHVDCLDFNLFCFTIKILL